MLPAIVKFLQPQRAAAGPKQEHYVSTGLITVTESRSHKAKLTIPEFLSSVRRPD
jgi:hypothetical protein